VTIINAINIIDGLDGLATGISIIILLALGVISITLGGPFSVLIFIIIGALCGFLIFNFSPATIFLGDAGSMMIGLLIGILSLYGMKSVAVISILPLIIITAFPIIDMFAAVLRRASAGQHIFKADSRHLHHKLLAKTNSQRASVTIIYVITAIYAFGALIITLTTNDLAKILILIILVIETIFIVETMYLRKNQFRPFTKLIKLIRNVRDIE